MHLQREQVGEIILQKQIHIFGVCFCFFGQVTLSWIASLIIFIVQPCKLLCWHICWGVNKQQRNSNSLGYFWHWRLQIIKSHINHLWPWLLELHCTHKFICSLPTINNVLHVWKVLKDQEDLLGYINRIMEQFGLEGTLKIIQFQPPCHGQGHLPLDQAAHIILALSLVVPFAWQVSYTWDELKRNALSSAMHLQGVVQLMKITNAFFSHCMMNS